MSSQLCRADGEQAASRGHVVAVLPRGEAIRNFVYLGALEKLAEAARVSILSVKPSDEIWTDLERRFGEVHELRVFLERYPVRFLRETLDMCHGRALWSEAARERWRRRDHEANTFAAKAKRNGKKLFVTPLAHRRGVGFLERLERSASRLLRTTGYYEEFYQRQRPTLVFNASHVHSANAIQAVEAAQWMGIPTATFIFSWDNLTSQGRIMPPYDHYLVWNDSLKQQLLDIYDGVRPEQVLVTGTPQFDSHFREECFWTREKFCRMVGADPARPFVLYATGMPNHMPAEEEIVEQIADMLREMTFSGPPQLMVRVYAKDRSGRFEPLKRRRPDILFPDVPWEPNWLTPKPEDLPLLTNMLRHCALGINVASTVSLELCMFDKPVINVGYNPESLPQNALNYLRYYRFDHYRPVVESGAVRLAKSPADLREFIVRALANPREDAVARLTLLSEMFGRTLDGKSGLRVAEALAKLVEESRNVVR